MLNEKLIKGLEPAEVVDFRDMVEYQPGKLVKIPIAEQPSVGIFLMAAAEGVTVPPHSSNGDALTYVLEGEVELSVDGIPHLLKAGNSMVLPANILHALRAVTNFKMTITMVRPF